MTPIVIMTTTMVMFLKSEPNYDHRDNFDDDDDDDDDDKNIVKINDEQRSIQMVISHRDTRTNTLRTQAL